MGNPDIKQDIQKNVSEKQNELNVIDKNKDKVFSEAEVNTLKDQNGEKIKALESKITLLDKRLEANKALFINNKAATPAEQLKEYTGVKSQILTLQKTVDNIQVIQGQLNVKEAARKEKVLEDFAKKYTVPLTFEALLADMNADALNDTDGHFKAVNDVLKTYDGSHFDSFKNFQYAVKNPAADPSTMQKLLTVYYSLVGKKNTGLTNTLSQSPILEAGRKNEIKNTKNSLGDLYFNQYLDQNKKQAESQLNTINNTFIDGTYDVVDSSMGSSAVYFSKNMRDGMSKDFNVFKMSKPDDINKYYGINLFNNINTTISALGFDSRYKPHEGKKVSTDLDNKNLDSGSVILGTKTFEGLSGDKAKIDEFRKDLQEIFPYAEIQVGATSLTVNVNIRSIQNWFTKGRKESYDNQISNKMSISQVKGNTVLDVKNLNRIINSTDDNRSKHFVLEALNNNNTGGAINNNYQTSNKNVLNNFNTNTLKGKYAGYTLKYGEPFDDGTNYKDNIQLQNDINNKNSTETGILIKPVLIQGKFHLLQYIPTVVAPTGKAAPYNRDLIKEIFSTPTP